MCSFYYRGLYDSQLFKLPMDVIQKKDMKDSDGTENQLRNCIDEKDLICKTIEYKCRKYELDDVVILQRRDRLVLQAGLIKAIIVRNFQVLFVVQRFTMKKDELGVFESGPAEKCLELVYVEDLQDSYPLAKKGTSTRFVIVLHHHIGFDF